MRMAIFLVSCGILAGICWAIHHFFGSSVAFGVAYGYIILWLLGLRNQTMLKLKKLSVEVEELRKLLTNSRR